MRPTVVFALAALAVACFWMPAAAKADSAPTIQKVALDLPAGTSLKPADFAVFGANGGLWLSVPLASGEGTRLLEVNVLTGRTVSDDLVPERIQRLAVGPDGNLWFEGRLRGPNGYISFGYVTETGKVAVFDTKLCCGTTISGFAAGADGALWFSFVDSLQTMDLGRLTTTGALTRRLISPTSSWAAPLIPDPAGGFWSTVQSVVGLNLVHVTTTGRIEPVSTEMYPAVTDAAGDLWGYSAYTGNIMRLSPSGSRQQIPWFDSPSGTAVAGSLALAADGKIWFTGGAFIVTAGDGTGVSADPVVGSITGVDATSWASAFNDGSGGPVGTGDIPANTPGLLAGPDGRLYAIAYAGTPNAETANPGARATGPRSLFRLTLPDQPAMRPATLDITSATRTGNDVTVKLRCTGQPGRYCTGEITVTNGSATLAQTSYAVAPTFSVVRVLDLPAGSNAARRVIVTSHDGTSNTTRRYRSAVS